VSGAEICGGVSRLGFQRSLQHLTPSGSCNAGIEGPSAGGSLRRHVPTSGLVFSEAVPARLAASIRRVLGSHARESTSEKQSSRKLTSGPADGFRPPTRAHLLKPVRSQTHPLHRAPNPPRLDLVTRSLPTPRIGESGVLEQVPQLPEVFRPAETDPRVGVGWNEIDACPRRSGLVVKSGVRVVQPDQGFIQGAFIRQQGGQCRFVELVAGPSGVPWRRPASRRRRAGSVACGIPVPELVAKSDGHVHGPRVLPTPPLKLANAVLRTATIPFDGTGSSKRRPSKYRLGQSLRRNGLRGIPDGSAEKCTMKTAPLQ